MELSDDKKLANSETLDLSGQGLKKLSRCPSDADISTLIADDNELQRLDNLDSYHRITKLSIVRNQLLRMYGVTKLHNLVTLNLANNGILTIEGIKDMPNLTTLCLAGNNVKSIEHLHTNTKLQHLDLSENSISHISDISYLRNLKELFLHNNRIITLRQGEKYLPVSLETLTLANNNITDLNEMSHLGGLTNLINFSIANNPCVSLSGNTSSGFDYRPFVINWCMSLNSIDGYAVDPIESLKAEWLYSQGRGRQFRVGEHLPLAQYLASVCPLSGESLENETDRKLRLILSKAQHHQKQLSQQGEPTGMSSSPAARRRLGSDRTNSPRRLSLSRNSMKVRSPDRMVASCHTETMASSCHSGLGENQHDVLMTQSLDPNMLSCNFNVKAKDSLLLDVEEASSPLQAATKLVPVPESLMSPDFRPPSGLGRVPPKTPPSRIKSPVQIVQPSKIPTDINKTIPSNQTLKTPVSSLKSSSTLMKSNSATNCTTKVTIAKPIITNVNGKCPQSVKLNNYVQSKTMTPKRNLKNSPNMSSRNVPQKSKIPIEQQQQLKNQRFNGPKSSKDDDNNIAISSDEESEVCHSKLDVIRHRANQRRQEDTNKSEDKTEKAAIFIQKIWRGYHTRNLNKKVTSTLKTIEMMRTNKYIQKLSTDMEATRTALESEHKLQLLQMQAINALWKKVVSLQPSNDNNNKDNNTNNSSSQQQNNDVVINLAQTCNLLHSQVQQLQDSMSEIKRCMTNMQPRNIELIDQAVGTQTEISAVHTPAGEENTFPYARQLNRPQSLSIQSTIHEMNEDKNQFNDCGFKKISQSTDTTDDEINTDILNSSSNPEIAGAIDEELLKHCDDDNETNDIANCSNDNYVVKESVAVSEETLCKELHNLIETETREGPEEEGQNKNEKDDSNEVELKKTFVE